jgi:tetratricopeptide (TPR) repeat protein
LNVEFCGLTGNEHHALPIIERHLPWLDSPASPFAAMEFASAAALVLRRLLETGQGDLRIRRRSDDGSLVRDSSIAEAYDDVAARARSLAAQFDARNGNSYQGDRTEAKMAAQPLTDALPLTVLRGRPISTTARDAQIDRLVARVADETAAGNASAAATSTLELAYALRNAGQWADAIETAEEARRSLDRAGLRDEVIAARYLLYQLYMRSYNGRQDASALMDEILAVVHLPSSVPAVETLLEEFADQFPGAAGTGDRLVRAAGIHREHGDDVAEARTLSKALQAHARPDAWPDAVRRLDELAASGRLVTAAVVAANTAIGRVLAATGDPHGALVRVEQVISADGTNESDVTGAVLERARLLLKLGRAEEAETEARQLTDDEDSEYAWTARTLVVQSLRAQSRTEDADRYMDENDLDEYDLDDDE